MTDAARCGNCAWWREGGPQLASMTRDPLMAAELGACELNPPVSLVIGPGQHGRFPWVETIYPVTHASRGCQEWQENIDPGPDDGEELDAEPEKLEPNVVPLVRAA